MRPEAESVLLLAPVGRDSLASASRTKVPNHSSSLIPATADPKTDFRKHNTGKPNQTKQNNNNNNKHCM